MRRSLHRQKRSSHGQARKATGGDQKEAAAKIWRRQRSGGAKDAKAGEVARKEGCEEGWRGRLARKAVRQEGWRRKAGEEGWRGRLARWRGTKVGEEGWRAGERRRRRRRVPKSRTDVPQGFWPAVQNFRFQVEPMRRTGRLFFGRAAGDNPFELYTYTYDRTSLYLKGYARSQTIRG